MNQFQRSEHMSMPLPQLLQVMTDTWETHLDGHSDDLKRNAYSWFFDLSMVAIDRGHGALMAQAKAAAEDEVERKRTTRPSASVASAGATSSDVPQAGPPATDAASR